MIPADTEYEISVPKNSEEIDKIRQQMLRVLSSERFKNSRRYPSLLRYLVEETLEGRGEYLKERTIGVRVFGCPADYDTAENPVVRVTIAEVRRRLAQYYQEEDRDAAVHIELLSGHYMPRFSFSREQAAPTAAPLPAVPQDVGALTSEDQVRVRNKITLPFLRLGRAHSIRLVLAACVVLLFFGYGFTAWQWLNPSALKEFWRPFLEDQRTIVLCMPRGNDSGSSTASAEGILEPGQATPANAADPGSAKPSRSDPGSFHAYEMLDEGIIFSDAVAAHAIASHLEVQHRDSILRLTSAMNLEDLRNAPVVLIGGIDNPWTLRAVSALPFRFAGTPQERYWIVNPDHPDSKLWGLDTNLRMTSVKRDYAIVARLHNESTGKVVVVVAGIGMCATAAAGQFLADERAMRTLRARVGAGFRSRDFEAVLSTDVVNGIAGSPRIEAVRVW
jgi:hypothetical protein